MRPDRALLARFSPATLTLAGILAVAMGVLLGVVGNTNAFGAAAPGFSPCLPGSQPIQIHYTVDTTSAALAQWGLNTYTLTGFDSACDGDTVVLTISGNPAGDPNAPATETLGTYDTALDPCTQQAATAPVKIQSGSIVIDSCATYGPPAGPADVHDATLLHLEVDGQDLPLDPNGPAGPNGPGDPVTTTTSAPVTTATSPPVTTATSSPATTTASASSSTAVLGETFTNGDGSDGTPSSALNRAAQLPFTGTYAALTVWIGLLVFAGGLILLIVGRRRDKPVTGTHRN